MSETCEQWARRVAEEISEDAECDALIVERVLLLALAAREAELLAVVDDVLEDTNPSIDEDGKRVGWNLDPELHDALRAARERMGT